MYTASWHLSGTVDPLVTAAGTVLVWKAPSDNNGGGVTITEAYGYSGAGTATVKLLNMGVSGTVNGGTIATFALSGAAAQVKGTAAVNHWVDGGTYVGLVTAAGTATLPVGGWFLYVMGR